MNNPSSKTSDRIAQAVVERAIREGDPWQLHAACGDDPDLMEHTTAPAVFEALAVCAGCPVIAQCKAWVDEELDYVGVAAGLVYTTRRRGKRMTRYTTDSTASVAAVAS